MRRYEFMYILKPSLDQEALKERVADINNIITNNDGTILELKEMGLKDLAYEIDKFRKGYYVWLLVEINATGIAEYKRLLSINEDVIRNIEVREGE